MADDPNKPKTPEERLVECSANGTFWEPDKVDGKEPDMDPANAATWNNRTFGADTIRRLAIGDPGPDKNNPWPKSDRPLLIKGARISEMLDLRGVTLKRELWLEQCAFDELVQLSGSKTKTVSFLGSHLAKGLRAKRATIKGSLLLNNGFVAGDEVNLEDVTIDGNLECAGGSFRDKSRNPDKHALMADNAKIGGDVRLSVGPIADQIANPNRKFRARGNVRFVGASVAGDFDCHGGRFHNRGNMAIDAGALSCRNLYLSEGFVAKGGVSLVGLRTQGQVACIDGRFSNKDKDALVLRFADIGSSLLFSNPHVDKSNANDGRADLKSASIRGTLDLSEGKCRAFRDSQDAWPKDGKLLLDGFTYEHFLDCPTDWRTRQTWLKLQNPDPTDGTLRPQPWTQAIKVLHDMGADLDSRQLAVRRDAELAHSRRWTISLGRGARKQSRQFGSLWDLFLHFAVGYGYKPWHAFYWSLGFFAFGWLTFATAANLGYMAPRQSGAQVYLQNVGKPSLPVHYTEFDAPLYALDIFLPIVELGQDEAWEPSDKQTGQAQFAQASSWTQTFRLVLGQDWSVSAAPTNSGKTSFSGLAAFAAGAFSVGSHRFVYWAMKILGWIFVSLFLAGMSGIMKKE
ncbi:MAG TPA: hypothetical protein VII56_06705 [Rhizomicrobium sp.]